MKIVKMEFWKSKKEKRIGLIDTTGQVVVPMRYQRIDRLHGNYNKYYLFSVEDSIGIVNSNGHELIKLKKWMVDKSHGKTNSVKKSTNTESISIQQFIEIWFRLRLEIKLACILC